MQLDIALAKNIGGRDEQQDAVSIYTSADGAQTLVVLADGMGGHSGGALASKMVLTMARKLFQMLNPVTDPYRFLTELCEMTHEEINKLGKTVKSAPRTTGVYLLIDHQKAYWTHIGDSRLYYIKQGVLVSRSRDHTVLQLLVDMGKVDEKDMGNHPDQNRLLASLGGDQKPEIEIQAVDLEQDDGFILCSDGFWEVMTSQEMIASLQNNNLTTAVDAVVEQAAERGGDSGDNIAVAYVRISEVGPTDVA